MNALYLSLDVWHGDKKKVAKDYCGGAGPTWVHPANLHPASLHLVSLVAKLLSCDTQHGASLERHIRMLLLTSDSSGDEIRKTFPNRRFISLQLPTLE